MFIETNSGYVNLDHVIKIYSRRSGNEVKTILETADGNYFVDGKYDYEVLDEAIVQLIPEDRFEKLHQGFFSDENDNRRDVILPVVYAGITASGKIRMISTGDLDDGNNSPLCVSTSNPIRRKGIGSRAYFYDGADIYYAKETTLTEKEYFHYNAEETTNDNIQ